MCIIWRSRGAGALGGHRVAQQNIQTKLGAASDKTMALRHDNDNNGGGGAATSMKNVAGSTWRARSIRRLRAGAHAQKQ